MTVYLVGAGPGDPGLLTVRAAALLRTADVVVHDRLVDPAVIDLAAPTAELVDVGKPAAAAADRIGSSRTHAARQQRINELLVEKGRAGGTVVRLKGGDPFVFGRGGEEAEALAAASVPFQVVPGVTSAFAVPARAGVPVTHRGLATSVTVVTGQVGDGSGPDGVDWESLAAAGGTLVVLMGAATRAGIADRLLRAGRSPATPVAVTESGTTVAERTVRITLGELAGTQVAAPAIMVIGPVAGLALTSPTAPDPERGPLAGRLIVLTRGLDRDRPLADALVAAGARTLPVRATVTTGPAEERPLLDAAATVGSADWLVVTSVTAVEQFFDHLPDVRVLAGVRVAAVGPVTAAALADRGIVADLVPAPATGAGLLKALLTVSAPGRVVFPRARDAAPTLAQDLRDAGWDVDDVETYATIGAPAPPERMLLRIAEADAVVFAAPSAVTAWTAWRDPAGDPVPRPPTVVCIGPTTADALRRAGHADPIVASAPTPDAVVAALAGALGAPSRAP